MKNFSRLSHLDSKEFSMRKRNQNEQKKSQLNPDTRAEGNDVCLVCVHMATKSCTISRSTESELIELTQFDLSMPWVHTRAPNTEIRT